MRKEPSAPHQVGLHANIRRDGKDAECVRRLSLYFANRSQHGELVTPLAARPAENHERQRRQRSQQRQRKRWLRQQRERAEQALRWALLGWLSAVA